MRKYIQSLDGIRGFGIIFVLLYHFLRLNGKDWSVMGFSWIWIQMFFVQSGFLITEILLESKSKPFGTYIGQFYWRRILRIFPVYFVYILAFVAIYVVFRKPGDFLQRLPYLLTFSYNYTRFITDLDFNSIWFIHFWSLALEEQFYLVWPFLVYFLSRKNLQWLIAFALVAAPVFRYWLTSYVLGAGYTAEMAGEITYAFTLSQFDAFAIGAAIPLFNLREKITQPAKWMGATLVMVLAAGAINYIFIKRTHPDFSISSLGLSVAMIENLQHVWSYSLINFLFLFVIILLIREDYKGIFNFKPLVNIGKVVYGMYIYHFVILVAALALNNYLIHNFFIAFVIAFLSAYGAAYISYHYFEKRFLGLRDFWWSSHQKK
jgi:peptidoglycan/LPS O-acetylase OafA/YrhL